MSINYHHQAYESLKARSAELMAEAEIERALMAAQAEQPPFLVRVLRLFVRLAARAAVTPGLSRSEDHPV